MYTAEYTINKKKEKLVKEKLLTIGIITKNECEKLERCLKSLMPLKEALDCEIIVTDTGSTDNTVEMAQNYADQILHFEWCNDFAAARNTGIKAAKGLWFMWIDSDEWLENPEGLIEFFKSGDYKSYGAANIKFINLSKDGDKHARRSSFLRFTVLTQKTIFFGKIHENIKHFNPIKEINSILYHDGYVLSKLEKLEKHKRNMELLNQEYLDKPEDLNLIQYIVRQYLAWDDFQKTDEFCEKGLIVLQNKDLSEEIKAVYKLQFNILKAYRYNNSLEYDKVIETLETLKDEISYNSYRFLDVNFFLSNAYEQLGNREKSLYFSEQYMNYYSEMNNLDLSYRISFETLFDNKAIVRKMLLRSIEYMTEFTKYDEERVCYYLKKIMEFEAEIDEVESKRNLILIVVDIMCIFKKYELIPWMYIQMNNNDDGSNIKEFEEKLICYMNANKEKSVEIVNLLEKLDFNTELINFSKIYKLDKDVFKDRIRMIFDKKIENKSIEIELILLCLNLNIDFLDILDKIDVFSFGRIEEHLIFEHNDIFEDLINYYKVNITTIKDIRTQYFLIKLIEIFMLEKDEYIYEAYELFIDILPELISKIYNSKYITENNIDIMPPIFRFGYFLDKATIYNQKNQKGEYLKLLKKALIHYPVMEKPIKQIVLNIEKKLEKESDRLNELNNLSKGIKQKIYELITMEQNEEALSVICQLQSIIPDDMELKELKSRILSK